MRRLNYSLVDVFTETALEGNPVAVFTNGTGLDDGRMQAIARELNLSETTFLSPATEGGTARIRIFTPRTELPFAGHPLIGTAYVLARSVPLAEIVLECAVGPIAIEVQRDGGFVTRCTMTQPEPQLRPAETPADLARALGVEVVGAVTEASNGPSFLLVPVADVDRVEPDGAGLGRLTEHGVYVYEPPSDREIRARLFAPHMGIAEDPATGSAAGLLGAHLLASGLLEPGYLLVRQGAHVNRPSEIHVFVEPGARPRVGGACVPVARGTFELS
jgi:trans-2,3-dihydro-3-hydroxyanthranilate isomerase